MISVRSIAGIGRIPKHRTSASEWLRRHNVTVNRKNAAGGPTEFIHLSDLPAPERRAVTVALIERDGLAPGTYDEAAHTAFLAAPATMRARAERKADIARYLIVAGRRAQGEELRRLVRKKFGASGTSISGLKRLSKAVQGVDPINFAPALLADYKGRTATAPLSDDAWRMFLLLIERASPEWPIISAWRDVRDVAKTNGWQWPTYQTVNRKWQAMPESNRHLHRNGRAATLKALTQPVMRDKTTIGPLEQVSLDGRTQDFWVDFGDGRAVRPVMIALVDVASNVLLDFILARSENAAATVQLIKRTCETYGRFDCLYTDNGSAFAGHLVAGGARHRFRNVRTNEALPPPPGICEHLGIKTTFAIPGNAKAKIAERVFATLSRTVDDRPEFKGAHAGHNPGASPTSSVVPVPVDRAEAILRREVARYNHETGRNSDGARGRSYQAVFDAGMAHRVPVYPTERQLYLSGLTYKWVAVDRHGRVKVDGWTYGGPDTQDVLLRYHGTGQKILLGRDPDNLGLPALAYGEDARLIAEAIEPVKRGVYASADGIREAARNSKKLRDTLAAHEEANRTLADREIDDFIAQIQTSGTPPPAPVRKVVGGRFGAPLDARTAPGPVADETGKVEPFTKEQMEEFHRNNAAYQARKHRGGSGS